MTQLDFTGEKSLGAGVWGKPYVVPPKPIIAYSRPVTETVCPYCGEVNRDNQLPARCHGCYAWLTSKQARRPALEDLRHIKKGDARRGLWLFCRQCGKPGATDAACPHKLDLIGVSRSCICCPDCRKQCKNTS